MWGDISLFNNRNQFPSFSFYRKPQQDNRIKIIENAQMNFNKIKKNEAREVENELSRLERFESWPTPFKQTQGVVPQSDLRSTIIVRRCYNDLGVVPQSDLSSTIIVRRCYNDLGVIQQSDLSSTIIVSRCYNDLNFFLRLTACPTKRPYLTVIVG